MRRATFMPIHINAIMTADAKVTSNVVIVVKSVRRSRARTNPYKIKMGAPDKPNIQEARIKLRLLISTKAAQQNIIIEINCTNTRNLMKPRAASCMP